MKEKTVCLNEDGEIVYGCYGGGRTVVIPEGIKKIHHYAFRGKWRINKVVLPKSLLEIGTRAFQSTHIETLRIPANVSSLGLTPFINCFKLVSFFVEEGNSTYKSIDGVLYSKDMKKLIAYPIGKKDEIFIFPSEVESISPRAFYHSPNLRTVVLPNNMRTLSASAFYGCDSLERVENTGGVLFIKSKAFAYCPSLKKVCFREDVSMDNDVFDGCGTISFESLKRKEMKSEEITLSVQYARKKTMNGPDFLSVSKKILRNEILTTTVTHCYAVVYDGSNFEKYKTTISFSEREEFENLDEHGVVRKGTFVKGGDILIGRFRPLSFLEMTPGQKNLTAIFGDKAYPPIVKSIPFRAPDGVEGVVDNVLKNLKEKEVRIFVTQRFPLSLGDVLEDGNGHKGVVNTFEETGPNVDIVADFPFDGTKVKKIKSARQSMETRADGIYNENHYPAVLCEAGINPFLIYNVKEKPQVLSFGDIQKIVNCGYIEVLKNLVLFQSGEKGNRAVLNSILALGESTDILEIPCLRISQLFNFLRALCIEPKFYDEKGHAIHFSCADKNLSLKDAYGGKLCFRLKYLTEDEIENISTGEVKNANDFFDEAIFGPTKDYECRCGKYRRRRFEGKICEKCHVEVTKSDVRYDRIGYIDLGASIKHPIFSEFKIKKIPILSKMFRPYRIIGRNMVPVGRINKSCYKILAQKQRMDWYREREIPLEAERETLEGAVCEYVSTCMKSLGSFLKAEIDDISLDYSARCMINVDDSLSDRACELPMTAALALFKPFLTEELLNTHFAKNKEDAERMIRSVMNGKETGKKEAIIAHLKTVIGQKKILLFGERKEGRVLACVPNVREGYVVSVNSHNWIALGLHAGDSIKIVHPITDSAQAVLGESFLEQTEGKCSDFMEELLLAAYEGADMSEILRLAVEEGRQCNFRSWMSRYFFCVPEENVYKNYRILQNDIDSASEPSCILEMLKDFELNEGADSLGDDGEDDFVDDDYEYEFWDDEDGFESDEDDNL